MELINPLSEAETETVTYSLSESEIVTPEMVISLPASNVPVTVKELGTSIDGVRCISNDRARFARAWYREFNNYGVRGGPEENEAFLAWFEEVKKKYPNHSNRIKLNNHPKYIKQKLKNLREDQFGYDMFGIKNEFNTTYRKIISGKKELFIGHLINNFKRSETHY